MNDIDKIYVMKFLMGFTIIEGIFMLFLLSIGLDYTQLLITQGIFSFSVLIFQIPAGILSDLWSRKNVLVIGSLVGIIANTIYANSNNFQQAILGEFLYGIAVAFLVGTFSSFAYDTFISNKFANQTKKFFSKGTFFMLIGGIIGPIFGGIISDRFGLRLAMKSNIIIWASLFVFSLFLKEPSRKKNRVSFDYFNQIKISYNLLKKDKLLRVLIFNGVVISVFSWAIHDLIQPHLQTLDVDLLSIGLIFSISNLLSAIISNFSYLIERKIGPIFSIHVSTALIIFGTLILGLSKIPMLVILGFLVTRVITRYREPLFENYFNKLTPKDKRATIVSFSNFIYWFLFGIFSFFIGFYIDKWGLEKIFLLFSLFMCIVGIMTKLNIDDGGRLK
ncbi:MAG: MFS transporter [Candidatus Aenigmatarchaeota archaeon]